jgi:hypothetical protein
MRYLIMFGSLVGVIAAIIGIKLADLPALVSIILVGALLAFMIYVMARHMGPKETKEKPPTDGNS